MNTAWHPWESFAYFMVKDARTVLGLKDEALHVMNTNVWLEYTVKFRRQRYFLETITRVHLRENCRSLQFIMHLLWHSDMVLGVFGTCIKSPGIKLS